MPGHHLRRSETNPETTPNQRMRRAVGLSAVVLFLLAGSSLLFGTAAAAQEPVPRIGLPEQPVGVPFEVSNTAVGVPVDTVCGDSEQIRFTFVAEGEHSSITVSDNESTFTVWAQEVGGLEPVAQYCDSGPNDTPISVGSHEGRAFTTEPGLRYWVSTWFDDGTESITINSPVDDPSQAPVLTYNEADQIDVQYGVGYGTSGIPQQCDLYDSYPVYRQFVAASELTRITVSGNEVDLSLTSLEEGAIACLTPSDFTVLSDVEIDELLGELVPDAVPLGLNHTITVNTQPGVTYFVGWIAEDRFENVVVTNGVPPDAGPKLIDLDIGVAELLLRSAPSFPDGAVRGCIAGIPSRARFVADSNVTRLSTTDDEVTVQVWNADDGEPAFCSTNNSWGSLTNDTRAALLGPLDEAALGETRYSYDDFVQTLTFDTIPGQEYVVSWWSEDVTEAIVITNSTDPSEASVTISCLSGNGRVDVNLFNSGTFEAAYDMTIGSLTRTVTVGPRERGRVSMSGRPDGPLPVTVTQNGSAKATFDPVVQCDEPVKFVSQPEVRVVNACENGLGFVFFQFANPLDVARSYIIQFEGVANRSTTAAPYGAAVRGVSARPSGVYTVLITATNSLVPIYEGTVEVVC